MPTGIYKRTKPPWNKGLTKETDSRVAKYAKNKSGKPLSEKNKVGLSKAWNKPGVKEKRISGLRRISALPEVKERRSKAQKEKYKKEEEREKHRKAAKILWQNLDYIILHSGENHFNWQGGKSFEDYPFNFGNVLKEYIRERDNRICQLCNKTEEQNNQKLDVHHIDYDKENLEWHNLISLCRSCHSKTKTIIQKEFWKQILPLLSGRWLET